MMTIVTVEMVATSPVRVIRGLCANAPPHTSLGTSACPNSTFYCRNEGHIGAVITSSRVNDGLCGECRAQSMLGGTH